MRYYHLKKCKWWFMHRKIDERHTYRGITFLERGSEYLRSTQIQAASARADVWVRVGIICLMNDLASLPLSHSSNLFLLWHLLLSKEEPRRSSRKRDTDWENREGGNAMKSKVKWREKRGWQLKPSVWKFEWEKSSYEERRNDSGKCSWR